MDIADRLMALSGVTLTLLATLFTWGMTALGAALVFLLRKGASQRVMDAMLGFAAGVMVSASFFSLLMPAIAYAEESGVPPYIPAVTGFLAGCGFLWLCDKLIPHFHPLNDRAEGMHNRFGRTTLLILAVTLHNIPEGLAVGVAIGAAAASGDSRGILAGLALAAGIGIQNFPEGAAVSLPSRKSGKSPLKAWWYGQLSGLVEVPAALLGVLAVTFIKPLLPYAMAFAAGAMLYVVFDELIPEAHADGRNSMVTFMAVAGLAVMMLLDIALG